MSESTVKTVVTQLSECSDPFIQSKMQQFFQSRQMLEYSQKASSYLRRFLMEVVMKNFVRTYLGLTKSRENRQSASINSRLVNERGS